MMDGESPAYQRERLLVGLDKYLSESRSTTGQQDAIRRLRVIDGTLAVRLGVEAFVLVHAVLRGGRPVAEASRPPGSAKSSYWGMW